MEEWKRRRKETNDVVHISHVIDIKVEVETIHCWSFHQIQQKHIKFELKKYSAILQKKNFTYFTKKKKYFHYKIDLSRIHVHSFGVSFHEKAPTSIILHKRKLSRGNWNSRSTIGKSPGFQRHSVPFCPNNWSTNLSRTFFLLQWTIKKEPLFVIYPLKARTRIKKKKV